MSNIRLGKTEIITDKTGFGALPIQRISDADAVRLLKKAYDHGVTFFDTARFYTDSEHKVGLAFSHMRDKVFIATKTMCKNAEEFWQQLETSLRELNTDYASQIPIFAMTANVMSDDVIKAKNFGMNEHIPKPFDMKKLIAVMRNYFR